MVQGDLIMSVFNFDGYSEFCDWCEENNYNPDNEYDREEEIHKYYTAVSFYIKHNERDVYMSVWVEQSYENGWQEGEIELVELNRAEKEVITTQVSYEEITK